MGELGHTTTAADNLMVMEMHENWEKIVIKLLLYNYCQHYFFKQIHEPTLYNVNVSILYFTFYAALSPQLAIDSKIL